MRFVVSSIVSRFFAIGFAVAVCVIAVLWNLRDSEFQRSDSFIESAPADATIFLQGMHIQLERLSLHDSPPASVVSEPKRTSGAIAEATHKIAAPKLHTKLSDSMESPAIRTGAIAIIMLMLVGCTCLATACMIFPEKFGLNLPSERIQVRFSSSRTDQRRLSQETAFSLQPQSQISMMSRTSARVPERSLLHTSATSPDTIALGSTPLTTASFSGTPSLLVSNPPPAVPTPALCPTIVMPSVEARFGIPLLEINKLMKYGHGELVVVGLSSNPLLRAVVKRLGNARSLEISMAERNGVPRATLTPASQENSSRSESATTLEIRGMQNKFYGYLVMTELDTYVTHEGQTVLSIGGQAASLELVLKSSDGNQAAAVRCSSEAFGGQDHVELRVEPGVDTVLVLAVVLSVLLLSPWSQDAKQ